MSFDPINNRAPLDAAQRLAIQHEVETSGLVGKRIRVLRALTFEGDAGMVLRQLAQSLPVGTREWGKPTADGTRHLSLTVVQGEIEIIDTQPDPDIDTLILGLPETLPQIQRILNNAKSAAISIAGTVSGFAGGTKQE